MPLIKVLFSFKGRLSRDCFRLAGLFPIALLVAVAFVHELFGPGHTADSASSALLVPAIWSLLAVCVKRCHDANYSGWLLLIWLLPLGNIAWAIWAGSKLGDFGRNRYGDNPLRPSLPAPDPPACQPFVVPTRPRPTLMRGSRS